MTVERWVVRADQNQKGVDMVVPYSSEGYALEAMDAPCSLLILADLICDASRAE